MSSRRQRLLERRRQHEQGCGLISDASYSYRAIDRSIDRRAAYLQRHPTIIVRRRGRTRRRSRGGAQPSGQRNSGWAVAAAMAQQSPARRRADLTVYLERLRTIASRARLFACAQPNGEGRPSARVAATSSWALSRVRSLARWRIKARRVSLTPRGAGVTLGMVIHGAGDQRGEIWRFFHAQPGG